MKHISLITFLILLVVSYGFYQLQYEVELRQDRVAKLENQIAQDKADIKVLEAEWALLSRPKRLQQLSDRFLELAPIDPSQIRSVDELAMREEHLEGAAFAPRQEKAPTGEDETPPALAVAEVPSVGAERLPLVPVFNRGAGQ
jgi:hypothetical protein